MGNPWTEEEKRVVAEMYADHFAEEIAEKLQAVKGKEGCFSRKWWNM